MNRRLVLARLVDGSPRSRTELAQATALTKPTVGDIVDDLLAEGLVREVGLGTPTAAGGRPPTLVELDPGAEFHLGVQVSEATTTVVLADATGRMVAEHVASTPLGSPRRVLRTIERLSSRCISEARAPSSRVRAAGVSIPGLVEYERGVCRLAPNLGWRDVAVTAPLEQLLGVPVRISGNAQCGALAEHRYGAARGVGSFAWLYLGSGVGSGIVSDGALFTGTTGIAGEVGHCPVDPRGPVCTCGRTGCVEALGSGRVLMGTLGLSLDEIVAAGLAGEPRVLAALDDTAAWLARGVAILLDVLDPELVVVGGALAGLGTVLLDRLGAALEDVALEPARAPLVTTTLGGRAELTGAVLLAQQTASAVHG